MLVGVTEGPVTSIMRVVPAANAHLDRTARYEIPPREILRAMTEGREMGEEVVGYFHSHPDRPAFPSDADRRDAWTGVSYLIVSVTAGDVGSMRSWRMSRGGAFEEERLVESARGAGSGGRDLS
jgi:proteasome lid subunit RPN8/RPN11